MKQIDAEALLNTPLSGVLPKEVCDPEKSAAYNFLLGYGYACEEIKEIIQAMPGIEPKTTRMVRHYSRPGVYADLWTHCEACGGREQDNRRYRYCPDCGAKVIFQEGYEACEE